MPSDPKRAELVSKVKKSVVGKKYSELSKEEFGVLFDGQTGVGTVCTHNHIENDSGCNWDDMNPKPPKGAK
jgi:hypothetical protein